MIPCSPALGVIQNIMQKETFTEDFMLASITIFLPLELGEDMFYLGVHIVKGECVIQPFSCLFCLLGQSDKPPCQSGVQMKVSTSNSPLKLFDSTEKSPNSPPTHGIDRATLSK